MNNSRLTKLLVGFLCASIVFSIVPRSFGTNVHADTTINYSGENPASDCSYRSVEEASFTAEVKTTNKWSGLSNIEIKFKNTGTETIHDWYFTFDFNYKIESPFNCRVIESKDNLYTIGNNDWNQDIKPSESVTIGFTASSKDGTDIKDMPTFYLLNTETVTLKSGDLKYKYEEYSNWSSGFNGALILTNKTKETIRDWTITFGANRPITQVDSSVLTDNSDGTYTITNDGNNQNIAKNQTYRIGIQGGANDPSKAFTLTAFTATAKKMALKLTDDKDKNGIADVLEVDFNGTITVTPTATSTPTNTVTSTPTVTNTPSATATPTAKPTATSKPTATITPTSTPTATSTPTTKPTISATPTAKPTVTSSPTATPKVTVTNTPTNTPAPTISSTPTPTATISATPSVTITATPTPTAMPTGIPDDIDYYTDTDKDGLPDDLEDYYGTDKNKKDTDGDGVNDLYELLLETDPLVPDSNGNNDYDNDGLTNEKESQLGTNPKCRDTDLDGLADGTEVSLYGTDPNKYDTDDDGMSDYFEVYTYDCNPIVKDSDKKREQTLEFYPKANNKLDGVVKVEISGAITGAMSENTKIRDIYGKDLHTSSIEALVGVPVDIETTGEFDEMTVRFYYEEGNFDEDDLMIMWYDEENGEYVEWEDTVWLNDGANYVEFKTNHFSKYMLIDEKVWIETWIKAFYSVEDDLLNHASYSAKSHLNDMLARYGDKDVDGLPDIMETNGMIDNIGHIVHTDPTNADSDKDLLSDGYEMGEISLTEKIFTRSYYFYNKMSSYVVSGDATYVDYVYFKCKSEADNDDSDGDGTKDGVDKTRRDKNEPVNYILYYDDPAITGPFGPTEEYFKYFDKKNMNVEMFYVQNYDDFDSVMHNLLHERVVGTRSSFTEEIAYSRIDNMIILFHGDPYQPAWNLPDGDIHINDVKRLLNDTNCHINNVDLLCCYGGKKWENYGSFAEAFIESNKVDAVYASPSETHFEFVSKTNYVLVDSFYKYYIYDTGYSRIIITVDLGWYIPLMYRV